MPRFCCSRNWPTPLFQHAPVWVALVAGLLVVFSLPSSAHGQASCDFDPESAKLSVSLESGQRATLIRVGEDIRTTVSFGTTSCPLVSVTSVDLVEINGGGGHQEVVLDLGQGYFAPGKTLEQSGVSEIELNVNLGEDWDWIQLSGGRSDDTFRAGELGLEFAGDEDLDVGITSLEELNMWGREGDDVLKADGSHELGNPLPFRASLTGADGRDVLVGGLSHDYLSGLASSDVLFGGDGKDELYGGSGNDSISGGLGDDRLESHMQSAGGNDVIRGDEGIDLMSYGSATTRLTMSQDGVANDGRIGEFDDIGDDIEVLIGSGYRDLIQGGAADNTIHSLAGEDEVDGGAGDDVLTDPAWSGADGDFSDTYSGGIGRDSMQYGSDWQAAVTLSADDVANDGLDEELDQISSDIEQLEGGSGDDWFPQGNHANGSQTILGHGGLDHVDYSDRASPVRVTIDGEANDGETDEKDHLAGDIEAFIGSDQNDFFAGSDGAERFYPGDGEDEIWGLGGDDLIDSTEKEAGADSVSGGDGIDEVTYSARDHGVTVSLDGVANDGYEGELDNLGVDLEEVTGSPHSDFIEGNDSANVLRGGLGDDRLAGLGDNDLLDGEEGSDTADYSGAPRGVEPTSSYQMSGDGSDLIESVENYIGSAFDDRLYLLSNGQINGGAGDDDLQGFGDSNRIFGEEGDDTLAVEAGDNVLDGGVGSDTVDYSFGYSSVEKGVVVDLGLGTTTAWRGIDQLTSVENAIGSGGPDVLKGSDDPNTLMAAGDPDELYGLDGDDTLESRGTDSSLQGGLGDDLLRSDGWDLAVADYSDSDGPVRIDLDEGLATGRGTDTLVNIYGALGSEFSDILVGGDVQNSLDGGLGADQIVAGSGNDYIEGAGGHDHIQAGLGSDSLDGGAGNDAIQGGGDVDRIEFEDAPAAVEVNLAIGSATGFGADTLSGVEDVFGSMFADSLIGDAGDNHLRDLGSPDRLVGGPGDDMLSSVSQKGVADFSDAPGPVVIDVENYYGEAAGDGRDELYGISRFTGSEYDDKITIISIPRSGVVSGLGGSDRIVTSRGEDRLYGGDGHDVLAAGRGDDQLFGQEGNDDLDGQAGIDSCDGGGGKNVVRRCEHGR